MSDCQHCGKQHPPGTPKCPNSGELMSQPGIIGTRVDRYAIERLLGTGGFGAVYRARHVHTDAHVALKLLKRSLGADAQMLERFLREAKAAASVGSDHIVRVLDAGLAQDGQAFLAMEYLDGVDLKELAWREAPLSPTRLVMITLQALEGLSAAHARNIVHRDMKPANVFVIRRRDERGVERDFVKLLDFGISKMHGDQAGSGLTMTGVAMGTPAYMAPEQFFDARNVDARADVYSVAVMMYELLANRLPFDAQSYAELIIKVKGEQPPLLQAIAPQVPTALAQVVTIGLSKDPQHRWQSALEFGQALRSAMSLPAPGSTPAFLPPAPQPQPLQLNTPVQQPAQQSGAGWVVPTGPGNTGVPFQPATPQTPVHQAPSGFTPAPSAGFTPGFTSAPQQLAGSSQAQVQVQATPGAVQPQKSNALKYTLIVLGVLMVSCCALSVLAALLSSSTG